MQTTNAATIILPRIRTTYAHRGAGLSAGTEIKIMRRRTDEGERNGVHPALVLHRAYIVQENGIVRRTDRTTQR